MRPLFIKTTLKVICTSEILNMNLIHSFRLHNIHLVFSTALTDTIKYWNPNTGFKRKFKIYDLQK